MNTANLLADLIRFPSVSSVSNEAISEYVSRCLAELGFEIEYQKFTDSAGVPKANLVACRTPQQQLASNQERSGGLAYFAHTDVVPVNQWTAPSKDAFEAEVHDNRIYGRGSCDMKGSLAAMITAAASVPLEEQTQTLWIACTADEEVGFLGAKNLVGESTMYRDIVAAQPVAIIGEPTSMQVVHAHKGIRGFQLISRGRAAHSSTDDGVNANDAIVPMLVLLAEISGRTREQVSFHDVRFSPAHLSWNYGVSDHMDAVNITPPKSIAWASLRPMPEISGDELVAEVRSRADDMGLEFVDYAGGPPMWIAPDRPHIIELAELTGSIPSVVCYGTDGGEFGELENRVVLGPGSIQQAHTVDEFIELEQLQRGTRLYAEIIRHYCCGA